MEKNVAGQKWYVFAFDETDNTAKTGNSGDITAKISADGGAAAGLTDVNPVELEDGYYVFDLTIGETNADVLLLLPESATGNIQVIGVPGIVYTRPPYFNALGIESDGDISEVDTLTGHTAQTADHTAAIAAVKAETVLIVEDTNELQLAQGDWATATGFSVPNEYDAAIAALPTAAEISLALLKYDFDGITGEAARSALNALRFLRNKWSVAGGTLTVTKENDTTSAWTAAVTSDAAADPITGSDPT